MQQDHLNADTGEGAVYLTGNGIKIIGGGGVLYGLDQFREPLSSSPSTITPDQVDDYITWLYSNLSVTPTLQFTLGVDYVGLRRVFNHTDVLNRAEFDPKLGVSWDVLPNTTVRAAWFTTLKRPLIGDVALRSGQTIEPTQVAGFNQLFDDFTGTRARRWGIGIDQRFPNPFFKSDTLLLGAEWSQRQLAVPITLLSGGVPTLVEPGWKERYGRGYLNWLLSERLAFNVGINYEALHRTELAANVDGFVKIQLLTAPIELRYYDPNGLLSLVRTTLVREQGQFFDVTSGEVGPGKGTFATLDMGIGWRDPGRPLIATLEAQNVLDSHFHYQDTDPLNPQIFPRRTFLARITFRL